MTHRNEKHLSPESRAWLQKLPERRKAAEAAAKAERELLDPIRKKLDHLNAVREGLIPPDWMAAKQSPTDAKPGSAAAWFDDLWPKGEWRLLSAKQAYQAIEHEAKERKLKKCPALRSVQREMKTRRAS
jgi:hypothetical protein